jgi:hypothetical protein
MKKLLFTSLFWFLSLFFIGATYTHIIEQLGFQIAFLVSSLSVLLSIVLNLLEKN